MDRKFLYAGIAVVLLIGGVIAAPYLLPKQEVHLDEAVPGAGMKDGDAMGEGDAMAMESEPTVETLRQAAWKDGDAAHKASGTVDLVTIDGVPYLHFQDFDLTSGPDVYLYLTKTADPQSTADVEGAGVRIDVVTEADSDARLNERGNFFVKLDMSLEALAEYEAAVAWCDDFNVLFGSAAFQ